MVDLISMDMIRNIGRELIALGVKINLIKTGHRGAYLICGNTNGLDLHSQIPVHKWNHCELWCDAFRADPSSIIHASGSGDIAVAAFLSAFLKDEKPAEALIYASLAGRNNLYCRDIYKDLPGWEEMKPEIKAGRKQVKYLS
jgi:sugar/nucleoside kinase (ribokinase family)